MYQTIFKLNYIFILALVAEIFPIVELYDLDNLGEEISKRVNQNLAPLHNLGSRISAKVEEDLAPLRHGRFYNQNMDFGSRISVNANPDLSSLNNLGQQIQESVYQGLEPVRAIEIVFKMKDGVGGTTIATHLPEGKKFIIRNRQIFECSGSISEDNGECSGTLKPFQINSKSDYCYSKNGYSIINNYICIGASSVSVINNDIICESNNETPALLITLNEYNKLCNEISKKVEYKYITNLSDPAHVEIPNKNKHVKCTNSEPAGVCIFSESHVLPTSFGNAIYINNGNRYSTVFGNH